MSHSAEKKKEESPISPEKPKVGIRPLDVHYILSNFIFSTKIGPHMIPHMIRDEDLRFFSTDPDLAQLENPDPTLNRNEERNIFLF